MSDYNSTQFLRHRVYYTEFIFKDSSIASSAKLINLANHTYEYW